MKKITFDTLSYSKLLASKGVAHADVHAETLASIITQNLYTKDEVDKMIEAALKQFHERTIQLKAEFKEDRERSDANAIQFKQEMRRDYHRLELEMKELERKIEESVNKNVQRLTINIGIMISLLTIVSAALHFGMR